MSAAYVNGEWRCYSLDGRTRHYLGCSHERPRQAVAHTTPTYVSPLRAGPAEGSPRSAFPLRGRVVEPSAGVREHDLGDVTPE